MEYESDYNNIKATSTEAKVTLYDTCLGLNIFMPGEYLLILGQNNHYYYLRDADCDAKGFGDAMGWHHIVETRYNSQLHIGFGLVSQDFDDGSVAYQCPDKATLKTWRDILNFTFTKDFFFKFFPYDNQFKKPVYLDGAPCYYIHDYYPVSRGMKLKHEQSKVSNLVFQFKNGVNVDLVVHLFMLAIMREQFWDDSGDAVLIPIAASTQERHKARFAKFISRLSKPLLFEDGYRAVWVKDDREQMKGTFGQDKLAGLSFNKELIEGKNVFLVDDILTTGQSFIQTKRKMEQLGAASVTGLFLGRTIDKQ